MAKFAQGDRALSISTPLGQDVLLLRELNGVEGISRLFEFQLDVTTASYEKVPFEDLLGQRISARIEAPDEKPVYFSGMVKRVSQGDTSDEDVGFDLAQYRIEMVPEVWLLTRRARSRIFQHVNVPDILQQVFAGFDVDFQLQGGFEPRNYCVQYRETDFAFVSRLMEEEGIFYFFQHDAGGVHKMVLADTPLSHPELVGGATLIYDQMRGGNREADRIQEWNRSQELRTGKYTLWDHNFELPLKNLEASVPIMESVQVGTVTHRLTAGKADANEIYDYPGEYAKRFDGIDSGGAEKASELQKIFDDNTRTVKIRMQEMEAAAVRVEGVSACRQMVSGHRFTLREHPNANGDYVLTSVTHKASLGQLSRSGEADFYEYENTFTCIPHALPFRPERRTPRPRVDGCQTATVVGPQGEEILTDKYGRVKVQFHWDREGKKDASSSCWLRVGTPWAGKQWGMIHIPRIGHEVIVDFIEGDPDRPIITGMVYNPDYMPPWALPEHKTRSGLVTRSTTGGSTETANELRFEDKKGAEHVYLHAEKNLRVHVENNEIRLIGKHHGETVLGGRATLVAGESKIDLPGLADLPPEQELEESGDETVGDSLVIEKNRYTYVGTKELHEVENEHSLVVLDGDQKTEVRTGDQTITIVDGSRTIIVHVDQGTTVETGDHTLDVKKGDSETTIDSGNHKLTVKTGNADVEVKTGNYSVKAGAGKITGEATTGIELKVGANSIKIEPAGITIKGTMVKIEADALLQAKGGAMAKVEGGGMLMLKGALTMIN